MNIIMNMTSQMLMNIIMNMTSQMLMNIIMNMTSQMLRIVGERERLRYAHEYTVWWHGFPSLGMCLVVAGEGEVGDRIEILVAACDCLCLVDASLHVFQQQNSAVD